MSTTTTTSSSPAHTVFHTTELLELILLHLDDTRTLLVAAARVNRRFRDTIRASLPLRRALFLAPVAERGPLLPLNPPGTETANGCAPEALPRALVPVPNELLARTFRLGRYDEPDEDHDGGYMPMVAMKWLDELPEGEEEAVAAGRRRRKDSGGGGGGGAASAAEGRDREGNSTMIAATPTWRRMLISQPPPRRVEVLIYGTSMFQSVKAWVECEEGVTLGMLHDKFRELSYGRSWSKRAVGWFFEL